MDKTKKRLKEQAQQLIVEALRAAEMRQGCTNYDYYAEKLLIQLEPIVWSYAPVPNSIMAILKQKVMLS